MADWDTSSPGDSDIVSQFPQNERAARAAVVTNFGVDHVDTDGATVGFHEQVTLVERGSDPTNAADRGFVYAKDYSGITELTYMDETGQVIRLTRDGALDAFLSGVTTASAARTALGLVIGTDVAAQNADISAIAALAKTDGNIIVGNGSTWVAESGATARTSLGLGSLATASTINGSNWSGADLAVVDGGTGSSTAAGARTNLGLGSIATADVTAQSGGSPSGGSDGDIYLIY